MCRDRLDQFCDRHDVALRAALLIIPAVVYGAYIAWAADRFDFQPPEGTDIINQQ